MPDLTALDAAGLVQKLADPNLIVRTLATNELVDRVGKDAARDLGAAVGAGFFFPSTLVEKPKGNPDDAPFDFKMRGTFAGAHALWALERVAPKEIDDGDSYISNGGIIGLFARKTLTERSQWPQISNGFWTATISNADDARNRRGIVEALALHPAANQLTLVLGIWSDAAKDDAELIHAARMALRNNLIAPGGYAEGAKLASGDAQVAEKIADVFLGAKTPEAAEFLLGHLGRTKLQGARSGELLRHAALYLPPEKLGAIAGLIENVIDAPLPQRLSVADNVAQAYRQRGLPLPEAITAWTQRTMVDALGTTDEALLKRALESVRETKLDAKYEPLDRIIQDPKRTGPIRAAALEAVANLDLGPAALSGALADASSMTLRKRAAELLGQMTGNKNVHQTLLAALPTAPAELATTIAAALAKKDDTAAALLTAIEQGKAAPALLRHTLVATALEKRAQPLRDRATALTRDLPAEDARLDKLIADHVAAFRAAQPDAAHGAQVFAQQCAVCHKLKDTGANLGPALDGVGARGIHRLTEDILDANRNVDPIFRQTVIETTDGQIFAGPNAREEGALLLLTDATGKPISVPKAKVKSQTLSKLSLMPTTFEQTLPASDFNALLAYLLGPTAK